MSWNPVLNVFVEVKRAFIERFGSDCLWDYRGSDSFGSCLEFWISELGDAELRNLISHLVLNEYENLLLIHYGYTTKTIRVNGGRDEVGFWDAYDGIYRECRSVVIDIERDALVLTPFRKFRNLNETAEDSEEAVAARIRDANVVEFSDKLDGSMQSARIYRGQLVMAGSTALDPAKSPQLADGYRMVRDDPAYQRLLEAYPEHTAIFEYISLSDPHIVIYETDDVGLHLVGLRDVTTGYELPYHEVVAIADEFGIPSTKLVDTTFEEVLARINEVPSSEAEGFVLAADNYKVKIKYDDYVGLHTIILALSSPNTVIRSIADGTWDDLLAKIPVSHRERIEATADKVFAYRGQVQADIDHYLGLLEAEGFDERKDAMLWIDAQVPIDLRAHVRTRFLGKDRGILKNGTRYVKMAEIESYLKRHASSGSSAVAKDHRQPH